MKEIGHEPEKHRAGWDSRNAVNVIIEDVDAPFEPPTPEWRARLAAEKERLDRLKQLRSDPENGS